MLLLQRAHVHGGLCRLAPAAHAIHAAAHGPVWGSSSSVSPPQLLPFSKAFEIANVYLAGHDVPDAEISARYLICDVAKTGYRLSDFHRASEAEELSLEQLQQLSSHCVQRAQRMPVQYILGNWDFFGLCFECRAPVLIPRPETEELVERVLATFPTDAPAAPRILDVGAGTGAIGISLLHAFLHRESAASTTSTTKASCLGLDISPAAVSLSALNAQRLLPPSLPSPYSCLLSSFLDYSQSGHGDGLFDLVVSNPPYIPSDEMTALEPEVAVYEDHVALHGGEDGLDMVRELLAGAGRLLRPTGRREMWIEVARRHPDIIEALLRRDGPQCEGREWELLEKITDLAGNPRFVRLRWRGG